MARIKSPDGFNGSNGIAKNSLDVSFGDLLTIKSGYVEKAVAGDTVVGLSAETKVFDSDNQTGVKAKLEYIRLKDETSFEVETSADITQANVGAKFNLTSASIVDGTSAGTGTQLILKSVVSARIGIFTRAK